MPGSRFVHFTGEDQADKEQIYFSVSRDGLHWQDLGDGTPVLRSELGDRGVRDPFIVRHPHTGRYYLIATDLCVFLRNQDWPSAEHHGSRAVIVWESDDLVNWTEPRRCVIGAEHAGCVWAPEAVWDEERNAFMVFFASMTKNPGDEKPKQRIYAVNTVDFVTFTPAEVYAEAENHLIDMTIVHDKGRYFRFIKDETTKHIIADSLTDLHGVPESIVSETLQSLYGLEGPECYRLPDGSWCLIADQFATGRGYLPMITADLASGDFRVLDAGEYDLGKAKKRHGGVIAITDAELERMIAAYGLQ